jgi:hypothetical protein
MTKKVSSKNKVFLLASLAKTGGSLRQLLQNQDVRNSENLSFKIP